MTKRLPFASTLTVWLFGATLFASAWLMFVLEPMAAKAVLPVLGGTPMVWNTCVLFFQVMLLGGYAAAHGFIAWLGSRRSLVVYLALLAISFLTLPLAIGSEMSPPAASNPIGWLLLVLATSVGLPFFVLSASTSALQQWFAETDHPRAKDPYFLYAASNLGSLMALIMYPAIIEPLLRLRTQRLLWSIGFGIFGLLACLSFVAGWLSSARDVPDARASQDRDAARTAPLPWARRVAWMALAFIPSSLMLAVTTYFSTDVAPVPLFWIVPLTLYLLTFVIAFGTRLAFWRSIGDRLMPILILPIVLLMIAKGVLPLGVAIPVHLLAFVLAALVCHGRLAADRPASAHLAEFYFWIAFGGMLGGVFNTLVAPIMFNGVAEYPIVLVLACAARSGRRSRADVRPSWGDLVIPALVGVISAACMTWLHQGRDSAQLLLVGLAAPAVLAFTQSRAPLRFAASLASLLVAGSFAASAQEQALHISRTFFGVYRVTADAGDHLLFHGTTVHGMQAIDPARQNEALTYFHRDGPIGQAFAELPAVATRRDVAVIGLGIGSLASYRVPGQLWTFYEIDPEIERIARTAAYFTYLQSCGDRCRVILGDARVSLARATDQQYGLIVLDAFSSDAVPVHLLTSEALSLYLSRLAPDGALAFNISNRHMSLAPVLARGAHDLGLTVRIQQQTINQALMPERFSSEWMVMARRSSDLGVLATDARWLAPSIRPHTPLWTDDFSNIVSVLNLDFH
jgi:spermidine synthase